MPVCRVSPLEYLGAIERRGAAAPFRAACSSRVRYKGSAGEVGFSPITQCEKRTFYGDFTNTAVLNPLTCFVQQQDLRIIHRVADRYDVFCNRSAFINKVLPESGYFRGSKIIKQDTIRRKVALEQPYVAYIERLPSQVNQSKVGKPFTITIEGTDKAAKG